MFNISFPEIAVILAVCLVIVGPKRLPEMARFCGHLLGRINRQVRSLRADIRREMEVEDLRGIIKDTEKGARAAAAQISSAIEPAQETVKNAIRPPQSAGGEEAQAKAGAAAAGGAAAAESSETADGVSKTSRAGDESPAPAQSG